MQSVDANYARVRALARGGVTAAPHRAAVVGSNALTRERAAAPISEAVRTAAHEARRRAPSSAQPLSSKFDATLGMRPGTTQPLQTSLREQVNLPSDDLVDSSDAAVAEAQAAIEALMLPPHSEEELAARSQAAASRQRTAAASSRTAGVAGKSSAANATLADVQRKLVSDASAVDAEAEEDAYWRSLTFDGDDDEDDDTDDDEDADVEDALGERGKGGDDEAISDAGNVAGDSAAEIAPSAVLKQAPVATAPAITTSVSMMRAFGMDAFGLLSASLGVWRGDGVAVDAQFFPRHGSVDEASASACAGGGSATAVSRRHYLAGALTQAVTGLAARDKALAPARAPAAATLASYAASPRALLRLTRLLDAFSMREPIAALEPGEWRLLAAVLAASLRATEDSCDRAGVALRLTAGAGPAGDFARATEAAAAFGDGDDTAADDGGAAAVAAAPRPCISAAQLATLAADFVLGESWKGEAELEPLARSLASLGASADSGGAPTAQPRPATVSVVSSRRVFGFEGKGAKALEEAELALVRAAAAALRDARAAAGSGGVGRRG